MGKDTEQKREENDGLKVFKNEQVEQMQSMREYLKNEFKNDPLYSYYEQHGMLDLIFTDSILLMDRNRTYPAREVANICETKQYIINNKKIGLLSYIKPEIPSDPKSKRWRYDYKAVFRLKMIDGLTGTDRTFNLPEIREMLLKYNKLDDSYAAFEETEVEDEQEDIIDIKSESTSNSDEDSLLPTRLFNRDNLEKLMRLLASPHFNDLLENFHEIESKLEKLDKIEEIAATIMESNERLPDIEEKIKRLDDKIDKASKNTSSIKKEEIIKSVQDLQDQQAEAHRKKRELAVKLQQEFLDERLTREQREKAYNQFRDLTDNDIDLKLYLGQMHKINQMNQEINRLRENNDKPVGFFARLFGGKK